MSHGGKHHGHHSHNLDQEVIVARLFWVVIILFFLLGLFLALNDYDLLGPRLVEDGGMTLFWKAITDVWFGRMMPVFIVLNILCFGVLAYSVIKVWPIRQKISIFHKPAGHGHGHDDHGAGHGATAHAEPAKPKHNPVVLKHWSAIVKRANTGTPENIRWSIMEADALVDFVLKERQMLGDTMADRLGNFRRDDYKTIDKLWDAHKLRNEIAHTPGFQVKSRQAERALVAYRDFLKEIKAF